MKGFYILKGGEVDVGEAPEVISILPLGHVKSSKGEFEVDAESLEARSKGSPNVASIWWSIMNTRRSREYRLPLLAGSKRSEWATAASKPLSNGRKRRRNILRTKNTDTSPRSLPSASRTARRRACTRWLSPTPRRSRADPDRPTLITTTKEDNTT